MTNRELYNHILSLCSQHNILIDEMERYESADDRRECARNVSLSAGISQEFVLRTYGFSLNKIDNPTLDQDVICFHDTPEYWEVETPANDIYLTAMHEIGHIVHPDGRSYNNLIAELAAHLWAVENALEYRPEDKQILGLCLGEYVKKSTMREKQHPRVEELAAELRDTLQRRLSTYYRQQCIVRHEG